MKKVYGVLIQEINNLLMSTFDKLPDNAEQVLLGKYPCGIVPYFCDLIPEYPYHILKEGLKYILQSEKTDKFEVYKVTYGFISERVIEFVKKNRCWILKDK